MPRPLLFRVLDAVEAVGFPEELRHLCIRYAYSANAKTGVAWFGQERMAEALGISERQLRRRLSLLDQHVAEGSAPVRIVRRRRGAPGGAGRSSDEWRIEVLNDKPKRTPVSGSDGSPSGQQRPVEVAESVRPEADIHDTRSGHPRLPEADTGVLGSSVGIQRRDPAECLSLTSPGPKRAPKKRTSAKTSRKREAPIPADWRPTEQHRAFAQEHRVDLELERVAFVGHFDGQNVKSPNGRFTTWLANSVKYKREREARGGRTSGPKQPNAGLWEMPVENL